MLANISQNARMDAANTLVSCLLPVAFPDKESLKRCLKKIVPLEQKYSLYGIPVKTYALRGRLFLRKKK